MLNIFSIYLFGDSIIDKNRIFLITHLVDFNSKCELSGLPYIWHSTTFQIEFKNS
jgi:hypothetical protein